MAGDDDGPMTRPPDPEGARAANKIPVGNAFAGKYRIERILGSGGMGTVLRAHHVELDRSVAIKVMHPKLLAVPDAARRFALEARATAGLKSAHAVRILDIDRLPSGVPFIVMELLDGMDLAAIVSARGPLSVDRALHYLLQAAEAIAEAHAHGIIHRDLKPQNIFLTNDGVVKVLDFGLAKALRPLGEVSESSQTSTNMLVGSPHYMSPEQMLAGDVGPRTDIWGFGATFYHLLAGEPPFPAPNMLVLSSHIAAHQPPRIAERRDDVGDAVDAVIARCLKKNPDERYQTIAGFQGALLHLRVALQTNSLLTTAAPGSTIPTTTLGATIPATTRRAESPARPPQLGLANLDTLHSNTEPQRGDRVDPDDEPTEITNAVGPMHDELASTRKR